MKQYLIGAGLGVVGVLSVGAVAGFVWLSSGGNNGAREETVFAAASSVAATADVAAHTAIFTRKTEEVSPGVHLAIGYGLANVIVIDAPDGLIMVDTLESIRSAERLLPWVNQLREKTGKPITDIIYTHNHADHVFGAGVFLRGQDTQPRIWAHEATEARVHEIINILAPVTFKRGMRMFGVFLPDANFENNGIGPRLNNDNQYGFHFLPPTDVAKDRLEVQMAG